MPTSTYNITINRTAQLNDNNRAYTSRYLRRYFGFCPFPTNQKALGIRLSSVGWEATNSLALSKVFGCWRNRRVRGKKTKGEERDGETNTHIDKGVDG